MEESKVLFSEESSRIFCFSRLRMRRLLPARKLPDPLKRGDAL